MGNQQLVLPVSRRSGTGPPVYVQAKWSDKTQVFTLSSLSSGVRLPRRRQNRVWTAEHVLAELESQGLRLGRPAFGALFSLDDLVRSAVGDPTVVADPRAGRDGVHSTWIVSPNGNTVQRVPASLAAGADGLAVDAVGAQAVLRAVAPFTSRVTLDLGRRSRNDAVAAVFGRALEAVLPRSGLGVRAVQDWARHAADETEPLRELGSAEIESFTVPVDEVEIVRFLRGAERQPDPDLSGATARPGRPRLTVVRPATEATEVQY